MTKFSLEKSDRPLQVVYLGESGFPYGMAAIERMKLLSKSLVNEGASVTIINRKGKFRPDDTMALMPIGTYQGIKYIYTSGTIYRSQDFFRRNLQKVKGICGELRLIRRMANDKKIDVAIVSTHHFFTASLYVLYARLFGFSIVLNFVEWTPAMSHHRGWWQKIQDLAYSRILIKMMDGALPISEALTDRYKRIAPHKSFCKIPVVCDFSRFAKERKESARPYFLYCGSMAYREVLEFILTSYDQLQDNSFDLYILVSGGTRSEQTQLQSDLEKRKKSASIHVFSNIPYDQLVDLYLSASAFLIPLRPTLQDISRFPHKIGEYLAAGNPIISTNFGEVAYYFTDGDNALLANNYSCHEFQEKMQFVIENPTEAKDIGQRGKVMGEKEFHYRQIGSKLQSFLRSLTCRNSSKEQNENF